MRTNRRSELIRYRAHVRELLADRLASFDAVMHPDFGLSDQDAADVHAEIEKELREPPKTLLMVTASTRPVAGSRDEETEPGYCLGMRFCYADGVTHVEELLIKQVRDRYSVYKGMKPREIRRALVFTVWIVPTDPTKRGGWPIWDGPTAYWR